MKIQSPLWLYAQEVQVHGYSALFLKDTYNKFSTDSIIACYKGFKFQIYQFILLCSIIKHILLWVHGLHPDPINFLSFNIESLDYAWLNKL